MNLIDHSLQRLWRAAARAPGREPGELPARLEMRILAAWRASGPEPAVDWLGALCRRGLIGAVAVLLLCLVWSWPPGNAAAASEQSLVNEVTAEDLLP